MSSTFLIVGGGQAGAQAIDSLRRDGFSGKLVLVGDEAHLPYQRPPLSKKYLAGEMPEFAMKLITAIIKPFKLDDVRSALSEIEIGRASCRERV